MADEILETNEPEFDMASAESDLSETLFGSDQTSDEGSDDPNLESSELEGQEPADQLQTQDPPDQQSTPLEAPKTWRKEAQEQWDALPPTIKQEVLKREEDMFRGIEGYKTDAGIGQTFKTVLQPYLELYRQSNINPVEHVHQLLGVHYILASGTPEQKVQLIRDIVRDFNINAEEVGAEAPYVDPQVQALQQQLHQLQSFQYQQLQAASYQQRAALETEVSAFASDPAHPHFDLVSDTMTQLVQGGIAKNLQDAYDRAVWMHPEARQKELDRQTAEKQQEAKRKAEEARRATSANIRSSAKKASGTAPIGSIDDTLKEALAEIRSREEG